MALPSLITWKEFLRMKVQTLFIVIIRTCTTFIGKKILSLRKLRRTQIALFLQPNNANGILTSVTTLLVSVLMALNH